MRRALGITIVVALVAGACSTVTVIETTSTSSTTTTSTTTTTTAATTTTVQMEVVGAAGAPELEELIRALYTSPGATDVPQAAKVSIAVFDEVDQVAVVEAGEDVTFAVADPTWRVVGGWWPSLGIDSSLGTFPKIVAVVGSDARPGHDPLGAQADSIHFVAFDENGSVSVLGLPRDSYVPVPGVGTTKATNSLRKGGPDVMMETFTDLTGLEFDGYLLTGFEGFTGLIGVLGGLDIDVPLDLNDRWAKAYIDAGRQILSPSDALAFARVRKTISGGDFTRKKHGGLALIAAASMVQAGGPGGVIDLVEQANDLYFTDLSAEEVLLLMGAIFQADLSAATNVVAPGYVDTTSGGASIVRLRDEAYELFEDLQDGRIDIESE